MNVIHTNTFLTANVFSVSIEFMKVNNSNNVIAHLLLYISPLK